MLSKALSDGADPDAVNLSDKTALGWAIETGATKIMLIIKQLLSQGADINKTNTQKLTPLMMAAKENNLHAVQTLLDNDADRNLKNIRGSTALNIAQQTLTHKQNIYMQNNSHSAYMALSDAQEIVFMLKLGK